MKPSTRQILKAVLNADDTITIQQQQEVMAILSNRPKEDPSLPLLLTQMQAARLLNVSRATIFRMVRGGQIHPVQIHGAMRYRREEIEVIARKGTG